jgi:hypothetical protein
MKTNLSGQETFKSHVPIMDARDCIKCKLFLNTHIHSCLSQRNYVNKEEINIHYHTAIPEQYRIFTDGLNSYHTIAHINLRR